MNKFERVCLPVARVGVSIVALLALDHKLVTADVVAD
jgi:hypothetical protein